MFYPCRRPCCSPSASTSVTLAADRVGAVVEHVLGAVADAFEGDTTGRMLFADALREVLGCGGGWEVAALAEAIQRETGVEVHHGVLGEALRAAGSR